MTTEAKVGIFTLAGIVLLIVTILFVGRVSLFHEPQMTLVGTFSNASGLQAGSAVNYSGVRIGKIDRVDIGTSGVVITMTVDKKTLIPTDSTFTIESDSILGDKFIQVQPGKATTYFHDGDHFNGHVDDMKRAFKKVENLIDSSDKTLKAINGIIGDHETQGALRDTLRTTSTIADNMAMLTAQMNSALAQNSGNINQITSNMVEVTRNVNSLTTELNRTATQFDHDGQAGQQMRQILDNLKDTTDTVNTMARSMSSIVDDPQAQRDIKETLHNTAQISKRINQLTGGSAYKDSTTATVDEGEYMNTKNRGAMWSENSVELLYNSHNHRYGVNGNARLFLRNGMLEIGAFNIGDNTSLNANYGKFLTDRWLLRGGLFEGDLGASLDYGVGTPFSISAAMINLNHQRYRIRSEYKLFDDTYGIIQITRPYSDPLGGNYFGVKHVF